MKRKTHVKYYKIKTRKIQSVCCSYFPYLVVRVDMSFVIVVREEGKVEKHYSRTHPSSSSVDTGCQQPGPAADRSSLSLAGVKNVQRHPPAPSICLYDLQKTVLPFKCFLRGK